MQILNRLAAILLLLALGACAVNPVTGDRQLAMVSESQEIEIGRQVAASAEAQFGLVDDPALQDYVHRLGTQLAQASERPDLPWTFRVVDDPTPNAFAAPGGYIFITRGLLTLLRNEAELVSILGHEIGHVTARHSVAMMSRAQLAQLGLGIASILRPEEAEQYGSLAAGGLQLLFLSYGREAEREADDLGYRYAVEQDYDVREMVNVFASLQRSAEFGRPESRPKLGSPRIRTPRREFGGSRKASPSCRRPQARDVSAKPTTWRASTAWTTGSIPGMATSTGIASFILNLLSELIFHRAGACRTWRRRLWPVVRKRTR
ncbi:MAG: M48 family metallopeptidase [Xanthomonadales bacterium]|nr:M48 family metallopeptidase [Xanthomonadales bacterium]